jgi:hypothetical protein
MFPVANVRAGFGILIVSAAVSCGSADIPTSVPSNPTSPAPRPSVLRYIELTPNFSALRVAGSLRLKATPRDDDARVLNVKLEWSTSDGSVATVSDSGLVVGVAAGQATLDVRVENSGISNHMTVVVYDTPSDGHALLGTWTAMHWEFDADSAFETAYDMIPAGLDGMLEITEGDSIGEVRWSWRETYRWWGPDRPTLFDGHATLVGPSILSTVDDVRSEFECDWGDCEGPLHGEYRAWQDGDRLVIRRAERVDFYNTEGPFRRWTRLTLQRSR